MSKKTEEETSPEILELEQCMQEITELKEAYPDVFSLYAELIERYNTALESASKQVRGEGACCDVGPFKYLRTQVRYDADVLFEELGMQQFLEYGGSVKTAPQYHVDGARFDAKAANGSLPESVIKRIRRETHFYQAPKKIDAP